MTPAAALAHARALEARLRDSQMHADDLADAWQAVLRLDPANGEARAGLARVAMRRGRPEEALAHLQQACAAEPGNAVLLRSLATAAQACGYLDEARQALEFAVSLQPGFYLAHLQLGQLHERLHDRHAATRSYFRALTRAQLEGAWLDEATTPAALLPAVRHAVDYVQHGRTDVLAALLDPLIARHGRDAMARVEHALLGHLGVREPATPNAGQEPKFLFFPGLPATHWLPNDAFGWIERLEAEFPAIRAEAEQALGAPELQPFLEFEPGDDGSGYLQGAGAQPRWDALFFYRHGERIDAGHARCPRTSAALESVPLLRIRGHGPEVCFSVLAPGTHILPHHGVTNVRAVVHLPLVIPDECVLTVHGEPHAWQPGRCVAFDDTYLHEAWNRGAAPRVVLLMDAWNPYLTEPERDAVAAIIEGIGDFNRG